MPPNESDSQSPIFWERLRNLFTPRSDEADAQGEPPRQRGAVITVCLLIASFLWLTFALQERKSVTLPLPTRVVNVPEDQALSALPPTSVQVQMEGEGVQLLWLYFNAPSVLLNASQEQIQLREAISLPGNVRVDDVSPDQVTLRKEPRIQRRVPVQSRVTVEAPPAHELVGTPRLEPDSIEVRGAESIVRGLAFWPTDSLTISDVRDTVATRVPLADTLNRLVTRSTQYVTFAARAGKFAEATREIEVEVTGIPSDQSVVALEPSTIRVRYRVLFDQLFESQRAPDFFATVSYDEIRTDTTGFVRPEVNVPSDLIIRDPEPIPSRLRYYTYVGSD